MDTPAVRFDDVSFRYGQVRAVDGLNLSIATGEVVALLGPNGAGKSTSIGLLLGLLRPGGGSVEVFGQPPARAVAGGRIGAMLQENRLLPRTTVGELLTFMHALYRAPMPVEEVLDLADLTALRRRTVERLSGGQAQRVRFAMALIGRPDLLVLDEPTSALDVEARREFWTVMRRYAGTGRTVLFSTHYLEEADQNADRIVVIAAGRTIADGTARDIKRLVPGRTVSIDAPDALVDRFGALPGVVATEFRAGRAYLSSTDSDGTVRALVECGRLRGLEVVGADLSDAFLALTHAQKEVAEP
jgi:ABC-2 type transport system ATP-binding protein